MNFPDNLLTSCTSIEQINLPPSHLGKMLNQHRDSDIPNAYIMSLSWIMGEGQMEKICWLLMNFPDNLLTSCTSIKQVNIPPSHIEKMLNQHRDSDIPNEHIMSFSWIMGDGEIENIFCLIMNFPDNLLTSCTSIKKVNLPSSHIGKIYYIKTGTVIFLTHILWVSSWIMGDG
jgi:hypothetical protein